MSLFFTDDDNNAPASKTRAVLVKQNRVKLGRRLGVRQGKTSVRFNQDGSF